MEPPRPGDGALRRASQRRQRRRGGAAAMAQRRIGSLTLLLPQARPPATALALCLQSLEATWQREGNLGALWQRWPALVGAQLAPHSRPLRLQGQVLTVGAAPGPWLQALQYHRHQLLGAVKGAGFPIRDVRVIQHHATALPESGTAEEAASWACHPSRADVHGLGTCPRCGTPAPRGEMARWGECSFCRRQSLGAAAQ